MNGSWLGIEKLALIRLEPTLMTTASMVQHFDFCYFFPQILAQQLRVLLKK